MDYFDYIQKIAQSAKNAFYQLSNVSSQDKNQVLLRIAELLKQNQDVILEKNRQDVAQAQAKGLESALLDRLSINEKSIDAMCEGLRQVAALPDPIGEMDEFRLRPNGLKIGKMRVPLGVIGMIYESRPNVTVDAAALCLKSGNVCILRGGSEAFNTNLLISKYINQALKELNLPESAVCFVENTDRESVGAMLQLPDLIDVIIPRGGKNLVERISREARVPVIKHLDGICHVYLDEFAEKNKAIDIAINAKTSRYGTCNTMETLLIHESRIIEFLPILLEKYAEKGVELRVCEKIFGLIQSNQSNLNINNIHNLNLVLANESDWATEYLAPILSIKLVENINQAISHINQYGSHHTDSIVTENYTLANQFLRQVDSSSVMINASTRFADGFEYGLGAEIGISTDKIHVRGPVGLHGLTSQKWIVLGDGQIRI